MTTVNRRETGAVFPPPALRELPGPGPVEPRVTRTQMLTFTGPDEGDLFIRFGEWCKQHRNALIESLSWTPHHKCAHGIQPDETEEVYRLDVIVNRSLEDDWEQ
ncbi:hypothetical protein ACWGJ2_30260 [Streptomyces sp. NPDC054796]